MNIREIIGIFQNRKSRLNQLLSKHNDLAQKQELIGAINEIKVFIKTLEHHKKEDKQAAVMANHPRKVADFSSAFSS